MERKKNHKFYKNPTFWTAVMVAITATGLFITVELQTKSMMVRNLYDEINEVNSVISKEKEAITKARIVIQNQLVDCPVTNVTLLKQMKKSRNSAISDIIAGDSGLYFPTSNQARMVIDKITNQIYSIKTDQICKINSQEFDDNLRKLETQSLNVLLKYKNTKTEKLRMLQNSIITI